MDEALKAAIASGNAAAIKEALAAANINAETLRDMLPADVAEQLSQIINGEPSQGESPANGATEENNAAEPEQAPDKDGPRIVETDTGARDGQVKCPKCGATDIVQNPKTGKLRCNFCRHEFDAEKTEGFVQNIWELEGEVMGSGAKDIDGNAEAEQNIITMKCTSCGAEVVVDTTESTSARCHWCRNVLSVNKQIPNGAVPDAVLPFQLTKNEAKELIGKFVRKRQFFANNAFKREFSIDNVMGVYFPYMIVDVNGAATLEGEGEIKTRSYTRDKTTYYDAKVYEVGRRFDIAIEGLTMESSADKLDRKSKTRTTNIINSIMPFDTENCVKWDSNYLRGFSSEKRDVNIDTLRPMVTTQCKDIARHEAHKTINKYDRGVRWESEKFDTKGTQWRTAYLPVWLYSYQQTSGWDKGLLHYVAVNARTKETMGSVPINRFKLFMVSLIVEILCIIGALMVTASEILADSDGEGLEWILAAGGFIYYAVIYNRYRNKSARHFHEAETKTDTANLESYDNYVKERTGMRNTRIKGQNDSAVNG